MKLRLIGILGLLWFPILGEAMPMTVIQNQRDLTDYTRTTLVGEVNVVSIGSGTLDLTLPTQSVEGFSLGKNKYTPTTFVLGDTYYNSNNNQEIFSSLKDIWTFGAAEKIVSSTMINSPLNMLVAELVARVPADVKQKFYTDSLGGTSGYEINEIWTSNWFNSLTGELQIYVIIEGPDIKTGGKLRSESLHLFSKSMVDGALVSSLLNAGEAGTLKIQNASFSWALSRDGY